MIKQETLAFLTEIVENNNREWFALNKDRYETAKADVLAFIDELIPVLSKIDPETQTEAKKCLMRIYRDIRFSKNKAPYKNNYGISFSIKGNKGPEYYLHLQPGKSFFAGGYWMPEAADLKNIREEIDYNTSEFLEIIQAKSFASLFKLSTEDSLKKAPKGYDPAHPQIELLKLKSYIATIPISDEELFKPTIVNHLKKAFEGVYPFVQFLKRAVVQ
ncbi:TIGR02453 family protein [Pedobacter westerhofensis]|uniref:TIGR02453 family protein n=1 Tax=Pedobacter westerhofensis TaxID=425512 RepID=A0A521EF66_9SPHI|nr:DUF2461 domain-containing protein [Pedobacter westerhofensis]SMO82548.1 TIGR02453 family protein [Pedobacter westerhofensis]